MNIECGSVRVYELYATVLVSFSKFILRIPIPLGVLSLFLVVFLRFTIGYSDKLLVKAAVSHECFLRMEVLVEMFSDHRIRVHADTHLFKHCVDVRVEFRFSTFLHDDETTPTCFYVLLDVQ